MHDFRYVPRIEYQPLKNQIILILNEVQDEVRDDFTFQYHFIGSTKRKMITRDMKSPIGFDFDVNIEVNDDDEDYSATDIRNILRPIITRVSWKYGFNKCEDSTRVITIKMTNPWRSTIEHSCDFAIVYGNQYIRFNKGTQTYTWEYQSKNHNDIEKRADILKNIWLFIPLGAILYKLYPHKRILIVLFLLSITIELAQYFTETGFCEFDDVVSNSLGGAIGYGAGMLLNPLIIVLKGEI